MLSTRPSVSAAPSRFARCSTGRRVGELRGRGLDLAGDLAGLELLVALLGDVLVRGGVPGETGTSGA
jgi:hypothetical protein